MVDERDEQQCCAAIIDHIGQEWHAVIIEISKAEGKR